MKTRIIKLTSTWGFNRRTNIFERTSPQYTYLNINEIKRFDERLDTSGKIIGSCIFYIGGVSLLYDDRTPDELMSLINGL
jgi:hypothetical protein